MSEILDKARACLYGKADEQGVDVDDLPEEDIKECMNGA
jgi:hypothetical protein